MEIEAQDFAMPSPKRQCTNSPTPMAEESHSIPNNTHLPSATMSDTFKTPSTKGEVGDQGSSSIPGLYMSSEQQDHNRGEGKASSAQSHGFLDALMQHVESIESVSRQKSEDGIEINPEESTTTTDREEGGFTLPSTEADDAQAVLPSTLEPHSAQVTNTKYESTDQKVEDGDDHSVIPEPNTVPGAHGGIAEMDAIPSLPESTALNESAPDNGGTESSAAGEGAEWEVDSSPYESSDSDISSDTTSDDSDDEDADGDYAMMDPEEQARILMQGDGGSDDEGGKKDKAESSHLRTANEKVEEVVPKPDIIITADMAIEELGSVEGVVEKTVLVKAKTTGEYQVLESGSLLCLPDRSVVGVVAEPLGRVEQPLYTIRFTNDEAIKEAGLSEKGTAVFYVPSHSTFVFTQPLKAVKGSDASNFHDEEVGEDEMEFSDDEAEAEHKRQIKMKRQGRRDEQGGRGRGRGGRGNYGRGGRQDYRGSFSDAGGNSYGNSSAEINYDDVKDAPDEGYTPLARPTNFNEMMAGAEPLEGSSASGTYPPRSHDNGTGRGRGRGRGRGDRDRRGGRGSRGGSNHQSYSPSNQQGQGGQPNQFNQQQYSPQSMQPPQFPYQYQQPVQPRMTPSNAPFSPSPISPLPNQQFNFNFQQQRQNSYPPNSSYQHNQYPQQQIQTPNLAANMNATFMQNFLQNQQQQNAYGAQNNAAGWNNNQAATAQVQAQLEQLRKNSGR